MAEGAIIALSHPNDILVSKRRSSAQSFQCQCNAGRIVKYAKRIDHRIEAQATADAAHLVGEAGAQEEQAVSVGDGLF